MKHLLYLAPILIILAGCKDKHTIIIDERNVVATINNENIYLSEIDENIEKRLYDILFEIYLIRKAKTEQIINKKIITSEAKKHNLSIEKFIDSCIYKGSTDIVLASFAERRGYNNRGVPDINNGLAEVAINSPIGRQLLIKEYKAYSLEFFLDSVRKNFGINILLSPPPASPKVNMTGVDAIYRGNINSNIIFWELSDFECYFCREAKPIYNKIYEKYKDRVKFAFTSYSGGITLSSVALESARRQDKFWELYDYLNTLSYSPDNEQYLSIAKEIGLDIGQFISDMQDSTIYSYLAKNFEQINDLGFYGTPTIIINNRKILDVFSEAEIENAIKRELLKEKK